MMMRTGQHFNTADGSALKEEIIYDNKPQHGWIFGYFNLEIQHYYIYAGVKEEASYSSA